jgi:hypothetical protein
VARVSSAQKVLEGFSSENLAASGLGVEVGVLSGTNIRGTNQWGLRLDFGRVAPNIRVLLGLSYFKADVSQSALDRLAQRMQSLVNDPTNDATIEVGTITWSDVTGDMDLQYLFPMGDNITPYAGLGLSVHARHGSGAAIDGTFVQDALGVITAGLNGTIGAEFGRKQWRFTLEGRGVLASGLSTIGLNAGVRYHWAHPTTH